MTRLCVDPGHGGRALAGRSSPLGVRGPLGSYEKDLVLELALTMARAAPGLCLTRQGDENLSLADRAGQGRACHAQRFLSLHLNELPPGVQRTEVWIHDRAGRAARELAERVRAALLPVVGREGVLRRGPLAVLDPAQHLPDTAACLVEIGSLRDACEERRLQSGEHRRRLAEALLAAAAADAAVVWGGPFDVWHEVPLVPQLSGMSCWAAAAAMIVGWRDLLSVHAEDVVRATGTWEAYKLGLEPRDVETLAEVFGLIPEAPRDYTVLELRSLLERNGPLWVGEASPGLHVVVAAGIYGDGTPDGTWVRIADPWPIGQGERYRLRFTDFARGLRAAGELAGVHAQILHAGGRRRAGPAGHAVGARPEAGRVAR